MWFSNKAPTDEMREGIDIPSGHFAGMPVGYIHLDKSSATAVISSNLPGLLKLPDSCNTLEACLSALPADKQHSFRSWIDSFEVSTESSLYTLELKDAGTPYPSHVLQCSGHCLSSTDGVPDSCMIWVYDLTASHHQLARIAFENHNLKTDVKRYSTMLNMAPFAIWERDRALNLRYCNVKYSELIEDIADQAEHVMPDIDKKHRQLAAKAWDDSTPQMDRRHIVAAGGQRRYFQLEEYPVMDQNMLVGFGMPMDEIEEMHNELGRYIAAQASFLESSASAMAVYGPDMRLKMFNYAFVSLWKLDESWLNTEPTYGEVLEALRENRVLPEQANFQQFKQQQIKLFTQIVDSEEEFFYLPDGRTLRVLAINHALGGVLFAYEDVTDRLALERSHSTLIAVQKETLDHLHEAVAVFGEDARLKLYNPMYLSMWGIPEEMAVSQPHMREIISFIRDLYVYDDWDVFIEQRIAQIQMRKSLKYRVERRDGKVIDCSTVPLPDGAMLISFMDVTDTTLVERSLRERNDALQEADRLKTEFLANVSYELRSPLTSISGFAEMLRQNYAGELNDKQREYMDGIHEASQQLMDLVNDILDLASIEAGFMQLEIAPLDMMDVLTQAQEAVAERVGRHNIALMVEVPESMPPVSGDAFRLKQCLVNLLSNAIRFSGKGAMVHLGIALGDQSVRLYVTDHGPGIPSDELPKIFHKFYKGKNQSTPRKNTKSGTGLGLSMVKNFIELHGGHVEVVSEPGNTTFTCVLPLGDDE